MNIAEESVEALQAAAKSHLLPSERLVNAALDNLLSESSSTSTAAAQHDPFDADYDEQYRFYQCTLSSVCEKWLRLVDVNYSACF